MRNWLHKKTAMKHVSRRARLSVSDNYDYTAYRYLPEQAAVTMYIKSKESSADIIADPQTVIFVYNIS